MHSYRMKYNFSRCVHILNMQATSFSLSGVSMFWTITALVPFIVYSKAGSAGQSERLPKARRFSRSA